MGSSVRYTRSKMKLLALIAASAYAETYLKDDANRYVPPAGFNPAAVDSSVIERGNGWCPVCDNVADLTTCIETIGNWDQCAGIENALCEYTFKYNEDGSVISVNSQCKDFAACHDNMRQNFDKQNQILNKCQKTPGWNGADARNGRYGAQDFQCTTCRDRLHLDNVLPPDQPDVDAESSAVGDIEANGQWNAGGI